MVESPAIEVENLKKAYGDVRAVDDISFAVARGEIFALLGPNGAGKTTTLECLEGLREPDSGTLRVLGVDPQRDQKALRRVSGVQLQSSGLPSSITSAEAIEFFSAYHDMSPRHDLLDRFGLADKRGVQYEALSGGYQRRLALALALIHRPPLVFLDEPTSGLDVQSRTTLHQIMAELKEDGVTIILASHDMAEVEKLADRCAVLLRGRIRALATPRELTSAGQGLTRISVSTRASSLQETALSLPGVSKRIQDGDYVVYFTSNTALTLRALLDAVEAEDDDLVDLRAERPSLEERFLELTSETADQT